MNRLRALSTGAWIAIGLAGGLLLSPAAAAAASMVGLVGSSGVQANVSQNRQLLTADATPGEFKSYFQFDDSVGCVKVLTVPATHGLVLESANADVFSNGTPGGGDYLGLFTDSTCSGNPIADDNPSVLGSFSFSFGPGFALAHGKSLYMFAEGGVNWETEVYGYLTPRSDVPGNTSTAATRSAIRGSGR